MSNEVIRESLCCFYASVVMTCRVAFHIICATHDIHTLGAELAA